MATPESQGGIDYPDGGFYAGTEVYPLVGDLAELAVRLKAPQSIDRLGNVVALRDFRYGIDPAEYSTSGRDESVQMSTFAGLYGGYSVRLEKVTHGSSYSGIGIRTVIRPAGTVGLEVLFTATTGQPRIRQYIYRYTGSQLITWGIQWDTTDQTVDLFNDSGSWTETDTGIPLLIGYPMLHSIKLVGDEANEEYERILIDGTEIELGSVTPRVETSTTNPHIYSRIINAAGVAYACYLFVDAMIVTVNEPIK